MVTTKKSAIQARVETKPMYTSESVMGQPLVRMDLSELVASVSGRQVDT